MVIGVYYRDINTDVGDAFDVRSIVQCLAKENRIIVFCSKKNKHKIISENITYIQADSIIVLLLKIALISREIEFFHLFCGFIPSIPFVATLLQLKNVRYVYSPFGQLMPKAIANNCLNKNLFISLFLKRMIAKANFIHVNSKYEAKVLGRMGAKKIVISALAIEGYEIKKGKVKGQSKEFISFIGRLDIWHKGLDLLLYSVKINEHYFTNNNLKVILAGRGTKNDINKINAMVTKLDLHRIVMLKQDISEEEKRNLLMKSYFFFHPSRVEGFARSMREAINAEIPIITTYDSNIGDFIVEQKAGYACLSNQQEVAIELEKALNNLDYDYNEGLRYLKKQFTWKNLCHDLKKAYEYY